jgi:hypothetical protein
MKKIFLLILLTSFVSCKFNESKKTNNEKTWIYIEIGKNEDNDSDAKYGEISNKHLELIKENKNGEKLIMISNARYNDEVDSIVKSVSSEGNQKGIFYYKVNSINYLEVLKNDPINNKTELMKE